MQSWDVRRGPIKLVSDCAMMKRQVSCFEHCWILSSNLVITALRLEIQLPFDHNEIIDPRSSSVKISNIFIDTSDDVNLYALFEVTSMDHFTKGFNLTFSRCELLQQLNFSHSLLLPPNRSMMVNLTVPLPFYAEHKVETCEGRYFWVYSMHCKNLL